MLLLSSITYGFAMLEMQRDRKAATLLWLAITGLFGAAFLGLELYEFAHLIHEGAGAAAQRLPVVVLHAGRHARPARHLRHHLAGHADGAGRPQHGLIARQPPPADVPVDVLALSRRGLDRRLHLRLPDGSPAMSAHEHGSRHAARRRPRSACTAHRADHDDPHADDSAGARHRLEGLRHRLRAVGDPDGDSVLARHGQGVRPVRPPPRWSSSASPPCRSSCTWSTSCT